MAAPAPAPARTSTRTSARTSTQRSSKPRIVIDDGEGRPLAVARIDLVNAETARAALHVEPGQLPPGTRSRLVDAVFDDSDVRSRRQLQVSLPLGDTEILDRVRELGLGATSRAAGSTCLVEAELPPS